MPSDDEQTLIVNEANIYWKMRGDEESFCRSNVNTCQGFTLRWKKISVELVVVYATQLDKNGENSAIRNCWISVRGEI